ncbi:protein NO VEIN domain-containing protein [Hymenobacter sp. B81]|uniref:protein NO VEIN domain-containing protein n=1 Tax=Hymenobacter sp. B81 TaxID=3344878 RepID=UPI0037DD146F
MKKKDLNSDLERLEDNAAQVKKQSWQLAEERVIAYEAKRGWRAMKVEKCGYDVLSIKGTQERHIEVKSKLGTGKKFGWTELTANEARQFRTDPDYFLYLVEGPSLEPDAPLIILELNKAKLDAIAQELTVVRFTKLGALPRNYTN